MANKNVIREFLVALGFQIDAVGERRFNQVLQQTTANSGNLGKTITAVAASIAVATAKIGRDLERMYYQTQRTGSGSREINAFSYAISQLGGSASGAKSSIEGLARFVRQNPASLNFITGQLKINPFDEKGQMKGMATVIADIADAFRAMPYWRAEKYAELFSIDEDTLMAMRRGDLQRFVKQSQELYDIAGIDAGGMEKGKRFMQNVRFVGEQFRVLWLKVGTTLIDKIGPMIVKFQNLFTKNFNKIADSLTNFLDVATRVLVFIGTVLYKALSGFLSLLSDLDTATNGWASKVVALAVAWRFLGLGLLATPVGIVLALGAAFVALYDDYKVWQQGGKSLFDWTNWEKDIEELKTGLGEIKEKLTAIADWFRGEKGEQAKSGAASLFGDIIGAHLKNVRDLIVGIVNLLNGDFAKAWDRAGDIVARSPIGKAWGWFVEKGKELDRKKRGVQQEAAPMDAAAQLAALEEKYGLPKGLLDSIWNAESGRGKNMVSPKGALGHFQFMPKTADEFGLKDPFNFNESADAAARKMSGLIKHYGGDLNRAVAAYNFGEGNLARTGLAGAPQETQDYLDKVLLPLDGQSALAPSLAGGASSDVNVNQQTTVNIHGVNDPTAAAREVGRVTNDVNQQAVRHFRLAGAH